MAAGPDRLVLSAGLIAGMLMATPAGALIDRIGRPRLMLAVTCLMIMGGTLAMFVVHGLWPILVAQIVVATGGALGGPSITALTMATIGKDGFPRQQGINQAATHSGNVVAAALIWAAAFAIGPGSSIAVLGVMATGMLVALWFYPRDAVDHTRMAGREKRKKGEKRGSTRALLRNHRLLIVILAVGLFNFGNAAVLPLLGQRLAAEKLHDATQWLAVLVVVAQAVMIPSRGSPGIGGPGRAAHPADRGLFGAARARRAGRDVPRAGGADRDRGAGRAGRRADQRGRPGGGGGPDLWRRADADGDGRARHHAVARLGPVGRVPPARWWCISAGRRPTACWPWCRWLAIGLLCTITLRRARQAQADKERSEAGGGRRRPSARGCRARAGRRTGLRPGPPPPRGRRAARRCGAPGRAPRPGRG